MNSQFRAFALLCGLAASAGALAAPSAALLERYAAEARATEALTGTTVRTGRILHPSPASPLANRGWAAAATGQLLALGVWD